MLDGPVWEETSLGRFETCRRARSGSGNGRKKRTHNFPTVVHLVIVALRPTLTVVAIIPILVFVYDTVHVRYLERC